MGDGLKVVLGVVVGALPGLLLVGGFSGGIMGDMGWMMRGYMMGGGPLGVLISLVFWLLILTLLVVAVVWFFGVIRRG